MNNKQREQLENLQCQVVTMNTGVGEKAREIRVDFDQLELRIGNARANFEKELTDLQQRITELYGVVNNQLNGD